MATSTDTVAYVQMIALSEIRHDQNVQQELLAEEVDALAQSIALLGQLTPVSVRPDTENGGYVLIAGHKRHAALAQLGHTEIRAEVLPDGESEAAERAAENCSADLHRNAQAPQLGSYGPLHVRYGKASRGSPPKRRTVLSVHDWAMDALRQYVEEVRDGFERGCIRRCGSRSGAAACRSARSTLAFATYRDAAGLSGELDLHSLRHSYVTQLIETGFPERFITDQVGHAYAATTAIYTGASDD